MESNKTINDAINALRDFSNTDLDALFQIESPPPTSPSQSNSQQANNHDTTSCSIMRFNREPFPSQLGDSQWSGINRNQSFQLPNILNFDDVNFNLTHLCTPQTDSTSNSLVIASSDIEMINLNETEAQNLESNKDISADKNKTNDGLQFLEPADIKTEIFDTSSSRNTGTTINNSFEQEFNKFQNTDFDEPLFDFDFDFEYINELERTHGRIHKTQVENKSHQLTNKETNQAATCPAALVFNSSRSNIQENAAKSNESSDIVNPYNCLTLDYGPSLQESQNLQQINLTQHTQSTRPTTSLSASSDFSLENCNMSPKEQRTAAVEQIAEKENHTFSTIKPSSDICTHDGQLNIESLLKGNNSAADATLVPCSVVQLYNVIREQYSDFAFVYALSSQLCQDRVPMDCFVNLKMGLLLSLASIGNNPDLPPIPVIAIGNDTYMSNYLLTHIGNLAARFIGPTDDIKPPASANKTHTWIEADPITLAKGGVFYVGDWSRLKAQRADKLFKYIECSSVAIDKTTYTCPLQTAIWAHWRSFKFNAKDQQTFNNFVKVFGIPMIVDDTNNEVLVDNILEQSSLRVFESTVDHLSINAEDMRKFLKIISKRTVDLGAEASDILQKYFVASRIERTDCLSKQAFVMLKQFSESFAKLAFRHEVLPIDAYAAIFMCENFIQNIFGANEHPPPQFEAHNYIGHVDEHMLQFQKWLRKYIERHYNKP